MSLDRYANNDLVLGNSPVFGEDISSELTAPIQKQTTELRLGDVTGEYVGGITFATKQEVHIYAAESLLKSNTTSAIKYRYNGDFPVLKINPEQDLRENGILQGVYSINYNFLNKFVQNCKIVDISGDRTEVKIVHRFGTRNQFNNLNTILTSNSSLNSFTQPGILTDLVLNFGDNKLSTIINYRFEGPMDGVVEDTLQYPRDNYFGRSTTFVPIDNGVTSIDTWRIFVEVYTPAIGEFLPDNITVGTPTGRARKYKLKINQNSNGKLIWQAGSVTFSKANNNLPEEVLNGDGDITLITPASPQENLKLTYERYELGITSFDGIVVKLNQPLASNITPNTTVDLDGRIHPSYIEKIIAFPSVSDVDRPDFSQPNYTLDMSDEKGASATNWQTWDLLLDVNPTTSQQLVSYYFSGSLGDTKLNIDYSDFANFVHFSSATERIDNFVYKLQQIENYNTRVTTLESVSGSESITNISQSLVRRDNIIGGFDDFENYLYYNSGSTNYTHWSSSAYTIEPYPKVSTFQHILHPSTSSIGETWYSAVYASASLYDEFNDARLRNMIPIHLQEDERNSEYITFIDMIGQHFDIQWTYIKSLTDINRREEHPNDGMADNLLKDIADSFGWHLSNGYSDVSLWKYALGVEEDGTLFTTGSMQSKSRQQIVHETWRRIVNTLPMLYKTKGTARSIKAILATYGIPQAFLKIREWGGPTISTRRNVYEHERFINKLELSPSKYLTAPWDDINLDRPNSIEVIGKMPKADYHIMRLSDGGNHIDYFWDYEDNETARIRLSVNGSDLITSDYVPYKVRRDAVFIITSASIDIQSAWVDDWGQLLANPTASFSGTNSTFNTVWNSTGTLQVPGPTTDSNVNNYETASIQEIRYFRDPITNEIATEHAKNTEAYFSDDNTSDLDIDTSFDKLMFRIFPDSEINTISSSIVSRHPNQRITETDTGLIMSASLTNITSTQLIGEVDTQFVTIPSLGALNLMNNKIRIESASLQGQLSPDKSSELSEFDYAPLDSNLLGTYFTTTDTVNFDIYASEGYFEADDWVGDPDKRYNEDYPLVKFRAKNYFQKYTASTAIDLIMDMLSRYDMSVFTQIQQLLPARVDWHKGILIEPHTLERNKYRRNRNVSYSRHYYSGSISQTAGRISGSRHDLEKVEIDLYDYQSSTYQYQTAVLSSSLECTVPNSKFITASAQLNASIGNLPTDNLLYNSVSYPIINRISTTTLEISSAIPSALSQTGTIYYSGSYDFAGQNITSSELVTTTIYTPISASITNLGIVNSNQSLIELNPAQFTSGVNLTPAKTLLDFELAGVTIHVRDVNDTQFLQGNSYEAFPVKIKYNGGLSYSLDLAGAVTLTDGGPFASGQLLVNISYQSESIQTTYESSNIVHKAGGANWPTDIAEHGNIIFNDGAGEESYTILERISSTQIKIDTSSRTPNTSGSIVSSESEYSASAQTIATFTIGDPSLITCVSESTYVNRPNGYWQYSPTGSVVLNHKSSKIYQVPKYFFSTPYSASIKSPSSSSMSWWEGQDDRLPLSMENLFYNGCRISSDSLTTDSLDTPDGGPVVEITKVDSNVLVYSTQTPSDAGVETTIPVGTKPRRVMPSDVLVGSRVVEKARVTPSVSLENSAMTPLAFIPKVSKQKLNLSVDKAKNIINKFLKGSKLL